MIAQLEITLADGSVRAYGTDETWEWSNDGPLRFADLKDGENYDARKSPSYSKTARVVEGPGNGGTAEAVGASWKGARLTASNNVPVREKERFTPMLLQGKNGAKVLDFGQNIAGDLEFTVKGNSDQEFKLTCGEVLDENGNVDLSGIREFRPTKGWSQMSLVKKLLTGKILWY